MTEYVVPSNVDQLGLVADECLIPYSVGRFWPAVGFEIPGFDLSTWYAWVVDREEIILPS